jgi:hypothetical protein
MIKPSGVGYCLTDKNPFDFSYDAFQFTDCSDKTKFSPLKQFGLIFTVTFTPQYLYRKNEINLVGDNRDPFKHHDWSGRL